MVGTTVVKVKEKGGHTPEGAYVGGVLISLL